MHYQLSSEGEARYQNLTQSTKMPSEEKKGERSKGRKEREGMGEGFQLLSLQS